MVTNIITGSYHLGDFKSKMEPALINIIGAIETLNDPSLYSRLHGMNFLSPFIKEKVGVNGHVEGYQEYQVYVQDDGVYQDAVTYKPSFYTWTFYRKGYIVKDIDFSLKTINEAYETGKNLNDLVNEKMEAIGRMYTNHYLPKIAYQCLFAVPEAAETSYSAQFGFLNGLMVEPSMLKPYAASKVDRVHYLTTGFDINKAGMSSGDLWQMLNDATSYLGEYMDVMDSNIVGVATRSTLAKLKSALNVQGTAFDMFERAGIPTTEIAGTRYIPNDFMPQDVIFFVDGGADHLITRLISPKADLRGIGLYKEEGFTRFEELTDLAGTFVKIQPEGYHLTGRHYGLFLDLSGAVASADATTTTFKTGVALVQGLTKVAATDFTGTTVPTAKYVQGLFKMSTEGFDKLKAHASFLKSGWYRNLRG